MASDGIETGSELAEVERRLAVPPIVIVDFGLAFEDPRLAELVALWRGKCRGGRLPARGDFDPVELKQHLAHLFVADVTEDRRDVRYRLIGTGIAGTVGRDATGMLASEVFPDPIVAVYRYLIGDPRPARTQGRVSWRGKDFLACEVAVLPLSEDGSRVDKFLGEMLFRPAMTD